MVQKIKNKTWYDETGASVPVEYISEGNRLKERIAGKILKEAEALHKELFDFKQNIAVLCDEVYRKMAKENKASLIGKGSYTFYNFDRSIKIEVDVAERIDFDDLTIKAVKEKLDEFLSANIEARQEFVKELITDAFSTTRGKLDAKKVMSLLKYRNKIKSTLFQEALNLLEESIRRPGSKTYYRVSRRNADNKYESIDLNFSSI